MRRFLFTLIILAAPGLARPQIVRSYYSPPTEYLFGLRHTSVASNAYLGSWQFARPLTITKVSGMNAGVSGGGAGSSVITFTDGTNICTATVACTTTQSGQGGHVILALANVSGAGCSYPANATITATVTTAGCTTTQPTLLMNFYGRWN